MSTNLDIWEKHPAWQAKPCQADIKNVRQDFRAHLQYDFYPAYRSLESCSIIFVCKSSVEQTKLTRAPYPAGQLGLCSSSLFCFGIFFPLWRHICIEFTLWYRQESGNSRWSARTCLLWFHFTKTFGPHMCTPLQPLVSHTVLLHFISDCAGWQKLHLFSVVWTAVNSCQELKPAGVFLGSERFEVLGLLFLTQTLQCCRIPDYGGFKAHVQ